MQEHGGPTAEEAIISGERIFHVQLQVDWNKDGLYDHLLSDMSRYVHSAVTDRSLQGATVAELSTVGGASAAELTLTLSGVDTEGRSLSSIFSPFQTNSPFWVVDVIGCEVIYQLGIETAIGVAWYPQFVGNIRSISPDRGANNVVITALDRVEALRKPVVVAPWAVSEQHIAVGRLEGQLMESQWLIDHALRQCDVSTSPWRPITPEETGGIVSRNGTQLYLTGNGGLLPTVGWMDNATEQQYPDVEGGVANYEPTGQTHPAAPEPAVQPDVFAAMGAFTDQDRLLYWVRDRDQINGQGSSVMGFTLIEGFGQWDTWWSIMPATKVLACRTSDEIEMQIWMEAGEVWTEWDRGGPSPVHLVGPSVVIPTQTYCLIHVCWDAFHPDGPMVYVAAGATNSGVVDLGSAVTWVGAGEDELSGFVDVGRQVAMQDIYFTTTNFGNVGTGSAYKPKAAKYAASVDQGLNRISFIPEMGKPQAWELIKDVANAEFGAVFWDEEGKFRFWNFDRLQAMRFDIVREITIDDLSTLSIESTLDSIRNVYAVQKSKARAVLTVAYESQDVDEFYVPPTTEKVFKLYLDNTVSPDPQLVPRHEDTSGDPVPAWTDDVQHGYVFQWFTAGAWSEAITFGTAGVDIHCYYDEDGAVTIRIWNGWAQPIRLARGNGDASYPAFRMQGTKVVYYDDFTDVELNNTSVAKYMPQTLSLSGDWVQEYMDQDGLVQKMLTKTSAPTPVADAIVMPGDPRLQMGDTIRLRDDEGFGFRFDIQINGIRREYSLDSGLTDSLTVEMLPVAGIWDDPVYGLWDETLIWG